MSICFKLGIVGRYCVMKGRNVISVSDIDNFSRKLDSRMVVICLFDELRDSVFVYIPDRNNIL